MVKNGNNGEQDHFLKKHAGGDEKLIYNSDLTSGLTSAPRHGNRFLKMPRRANLGQV
jgi:hypothetical protein